MSTIFLLVGAALAVASLLLLLRRSYGVDALAPCYIAGGSCVAVGQAMDGAWFMAAAVMVVVAYVGWKWWRNNRDKRRRLLSFLGAKSRALRDRLVKRMPKPSSAPRLQPQKVPS